MKEDIDKAKSTALTLGVDIGGSHITTGLVDLEHKQLIEGSIKRKFIDSRAACADILDGWSDIIRESYTEELNPEITIGIAMPGPFDYNLGISLIKDQDKFKSLYQVNIKEELSKRLGIPSENIRFINDAAGFLQGEVFAGAAKGKTGVMGLTLGTGLGSAFCINFKATDAALWDSPFLSGIAEEFLSTQWFIKRYKELTTVELAGVKELVSLLPEDHAATRVFMEFGHNLAQFLIPIINQHEIDTVIIGGNIAQAFHEFAPELTATLKGNQVDATLKISELKEHAALIGAASCFDFNFQNTADKNH